MARLITRPAAPRDIATVSALLKECITNSEFYGEEFKQRELQRLNPGFLRTLIAMNPNFVRLAEFEGQAVGLVLLLPDGAVLWTAWLYVRPLKQAAAAALFLYKAAWNSVEHTAFDKVCCYVRPTNTLSVAICERMGFEIKGELKSQLWGEDALVLEKPFAHSTGRYDTLPSLSLWQKIWCRIAVRAGL